MKVNWATQPGTQQKIDTSSKVLLIFMLIMYCCVLSN